MAKQHTIAYVLSGSSWRDIFFAEANLESGCMT
jgi:hypothetical protein